MKIIIVGGVPYLYAVNELTARLVRRLTWEQVNNEFVGVKVVHANG